MHVDHPLTFGVVTGQHQHSWDDLREQWVLAEELGFDSLYLFDHFTALYGDPDGPCLEASTLLAALARETSRAAIGVLVYGNTHRHPAILAKEIVTVDHVSGGRAVLGIGTGWNDREHTAYGIALPGAGDRVAMLDESLECIGSLLRNERTTFNGRFYQMQDAPFSPKPVQEKLPILVGGKRPKMLRVVARHADIWDSGGTPEEHARRSKELRRACDEVGREYDHILHSVSMGADRLEDYDRFVEVIAAYRDAGVRQFLFDFPIEQEGRQTAARIARELIPQLRQDNL